MIKELKFFFYLITIFFFLFFILKYYFSDNYKKKFYRSINSIEEKIDLYKQDIIILENNTNDIIEYVEFQKNKDKKKYHFWELLKNDR